MKKVCPLFSMMQNKKHSCMYHKCAWYVKENKANAIPEECVFVGINRNLLDIWLTIDKGVDPVET